MTDKPTGQDGHLDWNDLARLADLGPTGTAPSGMTHLAACAECQAAWAEAVRYRGAQVLGREARVPENLAAQALELIRSGPAESRAGDAGEQASRGARRPLPLLVMGGTLLAAILALVLFLPRAPLHDLSDIHRSAIQSALVSRSNTAMVFPGMTYRKKPGEPAYRAESGADQSLSGVVDQMFEAWQNGPQGPDDTWWLAAGYTAVGRLGLASDLIHQALRRYPDNVRLLHLDAITAWQLSEFDRSEHALNRILTLAPEDSTAWFNLALIQIETDRSAAAEPTLRRLAEAGGNAVLQERSRELLAELRALR